MSPWLSSPSRFSPLILIDMKCLLPERDQGVDKWQLTPPENISSRLPGFLPILHAFWRRLPLISCLHCMAVSVRHSEPIRRSMLQASSCSFAIRAAPFTSLVISSVQYEFVMNVFHFPHRKPGRRCFPLKCWTSFLLLREEWFSVTECYWKSSFIFFHMTSLMCVGVLAVVLMEFAASH